MLQSEIETLIVNSGATSVAVGFHDVRSGEDLFIQPDVSFHAASTMKVCVLLELFHQAEMKELSLDESILVHNEFSSIVDGSPYSIGIEDDSEQTLYARVGQFEQAIQLAKPMITHSSNLATNLLVTRLGAERISEYMASLFAPDLIVRRGVEDGKAFRQGLNNSVTARGLTQILVSLARGEIISPSVSKAIVEIMALQTHRNSIPAGVPNDVTVANKPGWNDGICHDCGIVFPNDSPPYVLTVLTRGLTDKDQGHELIAGISKAVFNARLG